MNFIFLLRRRRLALVTCFLCGINNKGNLFFKVKNCLITIIPIKKWSIFCTISLRKFYFFPLSARCALTSSLYLTSAMFCSSRESQKSFSGKKKSSQNYLLIIYTTCNNHPVVVALIAFWLVSLNVSFPAVFRNQLTRWRKAGAVNN